MLTTADLSQIRKVIREEVENETKTLKRELRSDILISRMRIQNDIDDLVNRMKNLEIQVRKLNDNEEDLLYADEE